MGKPNAVFRRWMDAEHLSCADVRGLLAPHKVKVTRQAVQRWRDGLNAPRRPAMKALVTITGGAVPLESW